MSKAKILVVEDEIIIARELEARLQALGYEVAGIAASGREAIALAEEEHPDLVLMDIVLKGDMDGIEAAVHIRRRFCIPVIYVTAFTDKATLERAQATQPYAYLVKPFAERELYANIEMTLYRHRVESKFRAMEIWFAASMEKIADGVLGTTNVEGRISYINPAAERLTGWSKAEAVGHKANDIFFLMRRSGEEKTFDPILQTLTDGITVELHDVLLVNRNGEHIPVNYVGACLRDDDGDPIGVVLVVRDLREQIQAEQTLRATQVSLESQRQAALNLAQDEMAARQRAERAEQEVRKLNAELEQRVRERTAELEAANAKTRQDSALIAAINVALAQFITDERSQDVFENLLSDLLKLTASEYGFIDEMSRTGDGQPYLTALAITNIAWDEESRALYTQFRAGELRWTNVKSLFGAVMTSGKPVIANDAPNDPRRCGLPSRHPALNSFLGLPLHYGGQMVGVIGLANAPGGFSDQTLAFLEPIVNAAANIIAALKGNRRRQQAEKELQQRIAEAQAANQELEAFSYSVSHDLRAPLRAIDGFSRILLEDYAAHLPEDGQRYLRLARENTQRMGQLIDDLLAFSRLGRKQMQSQSLEPTALVRTVLADLQNETTGRQVEVILGDLPTCQADPALLKQVFANLLANAFKFTRAQPAARVEIGCRNGDTQGEPVYFVKDNGAGFDMQYAHKLFGVFQRLHRSEEYPGTGVGLAIVQRIIHRHGGRVWAEGAVNQGATFYFTLSQGVES